MTRALPHAIGAALIAPAMPARPVRPARIIHCTGVARLRTTTPLEFDPRAAATAWIAEMRSAQAVR